MVAVCLEIVNLTFQIFPFSSMTRRRHRRHHHHHHHIIVVVVVVVIIIIIIIVITSTTLMSYTVQIICTNTENHANISISLFFSLRSGQFFDKLRFKVATAVMK